MLHQVAGNIQPPANQATDPVSLQRVTGDTGSLVMHREAPTALRTGVSWELAVVAQEEPLDLADSGALTNVGVTHLELDLLPTAHSAT